MNIVFSSVINQSGIQDNRSMIINGAGLGRQLRTGRDNDAQRKMREQQREIKLREQEDKMISGLREKIDLIRGSDAKPELKEAQIEMLTEEIQGILENRAKREQEKVKKEMEERQRQIEEKRAEQEKKNQEKAAENKTPEEVQLQANIRGLSQVAVSQGAMSKLEQTKAGMSAEAERLSQEIKNETGNMQIGVDVTIKVKTGHETPNDFKHRHLAGLNEGIAGLEAAYNTEIRKINDYRKDVQARLSNTNNNSEEESSELSPSQEEGESSTENASPAGKNENESKE